MCAAGLLLGGDRRSSPPGGSFPANGQALAPIAAFALVFSRVAVFALLSILGRYGLGFTFTRWLRRGLGDEPHDRGGGADDAAAAAADRGDVGRLRLARDGLAARVAAREFDVVVFGAVHRGMPLYGRRSPPRTRRSA